MVSPEQVQEYVNHKFNEQNGNDRIEDRGFAFYVSTQPREYLDSKDNTKMTIGNGPLVVVKETGDVYSFSSNPEHMFSHDNSGVGVNSAKTSDEFNTALNELKTSNDSSATPLDHIE